MGMPPAYWREYRQKHREHLNEQQKARRATPRVRAQRAEYHRRPEVKERERAAAQREIVVPLPMPYTGHPILEQARSLAGYWYGTYAYDANREDAAGEAVLAVLEGRDPKEAVRSYRASVKAWAALTLPLSEC